MARKYGSILTSIWNDEEFTNLSPTEQRLYLFLLTQKNLTPAGMLPLTTKRWTTTARHLNHHDLLKDLDTLATKGHVVIDDDNEELYLCGYFRHANIGGQPRAVAGAYDAIATSASYDLRAVASVELTDAVNGAPAPAAPSGLRAQVLQRDGWQCRTCGWAPGDPVPAAPTGRPLYRGLELDHIHPKSLGGSDSLENFQVLCTTCNTRKGVRV